LSGARRIADLRTIVRLWRSQCTVILRDAMRSTTADNGARPGAIRVLVVGENATVRDALCHLVAGRAPFAVVDACADAAAAARSALVEEPDVVLLDVSARGTEPEDLGERLRECRPRPAIVVLSAFADAQRSAAALAVGVTGWVLKDAPPEELFAALSAAPGALVAAGDTATRFARDAAEEEGLAPAPRLPLGSWAVHGPSPALAGLPFGSGA
jgi:DNA-binding NarL/FixJ family response regulator